MMLEKDFTRHLPGMEHQRKKSLWVALHLDPPLFLLLLLLMGLGLLTLYSASNQSMAIVHKQSLWFFVGLVLMIVLAQFPPSFYKRWIALGYCAGLMLLIGVLFFGVGAKGATRWLDIPGLPRFQPSEMMKLFVPMTVAWYTADRVLPPLLRPVLLVGLLILLPTVLIVVQPDLGTALLVGLSGCIVLLLAGLNWRYIISFVILSIPAAVVMWMFYMREYQKQRVLTFLNPEREPLGAGWNIIQSKIAIGSGGTTGKGWLNGTQSHLDFLPEGSTDFIIAVFAEEFGWFGVILLLLLYLAIIFRGAYIALHAQDTFSRLSAGGITLTFFVYVFVNIGMVSGILPVVGIPLPLMSYGGTSVVTLLVSFGVLMSIHTHRKLLAT